MRHDTLYVANMMYIVIIMSDGRNLIMVFLFSQLLVNGIIAGCIYALIGTGFAINYRISGFFDFAYGGVLAIGAYVCWLVFTLLSIDNSQAYFSVLLISACVGILCSALLSLGLGSFIYRPLQAMGATSSIFLLASLGMFTIIQNAISLFAGDDTKVIGSDKVEIGIPIYLFGSEPIRITYVQVGIIFTTFLVGAILIWLLQYSSWGKKLRAVANDGELAEIYGVNVAGIRLSVHALAGGLAGLAGVLIAFDTSLTPFMGFRMLALVMVAMVIGGLDSLLGVVVGAACVGLVQNLSAIVVGTEWQDAVVFVLLIGFLLARPYGLFGSKNLK